MKEISNLQLAAIWKLTAIVTAILKIAAILGLAHI